MFCNICENRSKFIFNAIVLNKFNVSYYKCTECGFIQVETPYWLSEAYSEAISSLDVGLVQRNLDLSNFTEDLIKNNFSYKAKFLDYAGGYGLFVRLMRDKGFDFYRQDSFCKNIFAIHFDIEDLPELPKFELITTFEAFEHFINPVDEITKMFKLSDSILFSTEVQPSKTINSVEDWWYFVPEGGQHISFYTLKSLELISKYFGCNFYSNGSNLHIFTLKKFDNNTFMRKKSFLNRLLLRLLKIYKSKFKLESLLQSDFNKIINEIFRNSSN